MELYRGKNCCIPAIQRCCKCHVNMHDVFQTSKVDQREREIFELSVEVQGNLNCIVRFDVHQDQVH